MHPAPDGVELLERSLGYTRAVLSRVRDDHLARRTPCPAWDLAALLDHMDDALAAFAEAAEGSVALAAAPPAGPLPARDRVARLQARACALLGSWSAAPVRPVRLGDWWLPSGTVAGAAALEITVHGWDVARAIDPGGGASGLPGGLARDLRAVALRTVGEGDRGRRFAPALAVPASAGADVRLLALLGRRAA